MMKTLVILAGVLGLVNQSSAQNTGYGMSPHEQGVLKCNLQNAITASAETQKVVGTQGTTYLCTFGSKAFEITFVGVTFKLTEAKNEGSKLALTLQCTTDQPTGIYAFGGYPVGFHTSSFQNFPWFYNPNPKAPGGRCFITGDKVLSQKLTAITNKSVMLIAPLKAALN